MNKIYESNQLHFFCQNGEISPDSDGEKIITAIQAALPDNNFTPIVANEFNVGPTGGKSRNYLTLVDNSKYLRIEFPSNEIIVLMDKVSPLDFQKIAAAITSSLKPILGLKKANRLSVTNSQIFDGTEAEYAELYKKIFTHRDVKPFEWDNRIVTKNKIEWAQEEINCISIVRRVKVRIGNDQPKDVIAFDIDSNTLAQNEHHRFSIEESEKIYQGLFDSNKSLLDQISRYQ